MGESDDKLTSSSSPNQVFTVLPLGTPAIGVFGSEGGGAEEAEGEWNKGDGGRNRGRKKKAEGQN